MLNKNDKFKKVFKAMENESRQLLKILVNNFNEELELKLSKESKEDLISNINDAFYTALESKINGNGSTSNLKKNDDSITIENNKGCINIGSGNSKITSTHTTTTVIRKSKKNY